MILSINQIVAPSLARLHEALFEKDLINFICWPAAVACCVKRKQSWRKRRKYLDALILSRVGLEVLKRLLCIFIENKSETLLSIELTLQRAARKKKDLALCNKIISSFMYYSVFLFFVLLSYLSPQFKHPFTTQHPWQPLLPVESFVFVVCCCQSKEIWQPDLIITCQIDNFTNIFWQRLPSVNTTGIFNIALHFGAELQIISQTC